VIREGGSESWDILRARRRQLGATQIELAVALDLPLSTLQRLEQGDYAGNEDAAVLVAEYFDVEPDEMFPGLELLIPLTPGELAAFLDWSALAEDPFNSAALSADLQAAFQRLTPRDQRVLTLRLGLEDGHARTLQEAGNVVGVSRERLRQLELRALRRLRYRLTQHWRCKPPPAPPAPVVAAPVDTQPPPPRSRPLLACAPPRGVLELPADHSVGSIVGVDPRQIWFSGLPLNATISFYDDLPRVRGFGVTIINMNARSLTVTRAVALNIRINDVPLIGEWYLEPHAVLSPRYLTSIIFDAPDLAPGLRTILTPASRATVDVTAEVRFMFGADELMLKLNRLCLHATW